jgi:ABC-type uncharacterized transport system substrate-binding protein
LLLFRLLIAFILFGLTSLVQAAPLRVTLLLAEEGVAYREFAQAFASEAARLNLQLSLTQTSELTEEADLVVAVGQKSSNLAIKGRVPVLMVLLSKASFQKLRQDELAHRDKKSISAIYFDQPTKRQLNLIEVVFPQAKKVGLMFSTASSDVIELRKAIAGSRLSLVENQLTSTDSLHSQLIGVLESSDVLLTLPDAQIYNPSTMRNILLDSYQYKVPLIGISPSYVRAGALCAVFSNPEQLAVQAVSLTQQFVTDKTLPEPQYPRDFDVHLNYQVARSMNVRVKEVAEIVNALRSLEPNEGVKSAR